MAASLSGVFNLQVMTNTGAPAFNHRLYTYTNVTTTQKTAWTDAAGTVAHTYTSDGAGGQYIALNARGELPAPLFLTSGPYDLVLKDTLGAAVWSRYAAGSSDTALALVFDLASTAAGKGSSLVAVRDAGANFPDLATKTTETVFAALAARLYGVNVTKYGIGLTGSSDWTAAFASAIATGRQVYVPAGTYKLNLVITSSFTGIIGDGLAKTILSPFVAGNPVIKIDGDAAGTYVNYTRLENLSIVGSGRAGHGLSVVNTSDLRGCDYLQLRNISITACNYGINVAGRSIWNRFENVFLDFNFDGLHVETDMAINSWDFSQFRSSRNQRHGVFAYKTNVAIAGAICWTATNFNSEYNGQDSAQNPVYGIYLNGVEGFNITGLVLENNGDALATPSGGYGLYITGTLARGVVIDGAWIVNSYHPVKIDSSKLSGRIDNIYRLTPAYGGTLGLEITSPWSNNEAKMKLGAINGSVSVAADVNGNYAAEGYTDYEATRPTSIDLTYRKKLALNSSAGAWTITAIAGLQPGDEIMLHNYAPSGGNSFTLAAGLMQSAASYAVAANIAKKFTVTNAIAGVLKLMPI